MSALELGRLFSLMEGVDPEGLFTAALRMSAGDALPQLAGLPPQLAGLEGLAASQMDDGNIKSVADPSGDLQEGGGSTDEDSRGSVGGTGGGGSGHIIPPRTGSINDRKCTKVGGYGMVAGGVGGCMSSEQIWAMPPPPILGAAPTSRTSSWQPLMLVPTYRFCPPCG